MSRATRSGDCCCWCRSCAVPRRFKHHGVAVAPVEILFRAVNKLEAGHQRRVLDDVRRVVGHQLAGPIDRQHEFPVKIGGQPAGRQGIELRSDLSCCQLGVPESDLVQRPVARTAEGGPAAAVIPPTAQGDRAGASDHHRVSDVDGTIGQRASYGPNNTK